MRLTHSTTPFVTDRGAKYAARFICRDCSYEMRGLPKAAGFWWSPSEKLWWTPKTEAARLLAEYADDGAKAIIGGHETNLKASAASDADIEIPAPAGLSYLPYQRAGIAYALARFADGQDGVLIADEMGLGKTIQALGVVNADESIKRVLIVCPASLKLNWQREAQKWLTRGQTVAIWSSKAQPEADVIVINYDVIKRLTSLLGAVNWDLLILDESHYVKNQKAARTKATLALPAKRVLALTGTPILNRPIELFPVLNRLDPAQFKSFPGFGIRYAAGFQGRWGWDFTGASHLDELQEKLRSKIMVRRLKADVLTELPPKRRQIVPLEPEAAARKLIKRQNAAFDAAIGAMGYDAAVAQLMAGDTVGFEEMSELRKELALAKAEAAIDYIKEALESSDKIVVFAHHHGLLDALADGLAEYGVAKLDGRTSMDSRQAAVDRFQNDSACRVFVGGIAAAGVGLTLTAASHVILAELPWRPADVQQAEDRCHRIGQTDSVLVQHLVFDGSLDANMAQLILEKQAVADAALDHDHDADKAALIAGAKAEAAIETAKSQIIRGEVEAKIAAGPALTLEQIGWIHYCLRLLAGRCDGAAKKDDAGFNRLDSRFGHILADADKLTTRMAQAGMQMLRKYKAQIPADIYAAIYKEEAAAPPPGKE